MNVSGISLIIAFHGAVLAAALLRIKFEKNRPYRWLSALLILLSAILIISPDSGLFSGDHVVETEGLLYYLIGPALLAFICSITGVPLSTRSMYLLISPAIVLFSIFVLSYITPLYESNAGFYLITFVYEWNWMGSSILEFLCIIFSFQTISASLHRVKDMSAGDEPILVGRLKFFLSVYTLFFLIDFTQELSGILFDLPELMHTFTSRILGALWFALIAYLLIANLDRYRRFQIAATPLKKYRRSGLSDPEATILFQQAEKYMQLNQFFSEYDCTLPALARELGVTIHDLSQAINSGSGGNFAFFVNRFRVNRARKLLHDNSHDHLNILQIAIESGFYSKATFNRAFREITGQTPTLYRKTQK